MRFLAARTTAPRAATLRELYGALAPVAVVPADGDVLVCPGRDTRVGAGDEVTLIGTPDELARRRRHRSSGTDRGSLRAAQRAAPAGRGSGRRRTSRAVAMLACRCARAPTAGW